MIHRKFDGLKFSRTYIGGSKKSENQAFWDVQGVKEDNSDCDWFEYRRMLKEYLDDRLNVLLTWRYTTNILSIVFAVVALILTFRNVVLGLIVLQVSIILLAISKFLNHKEKNILSIYNFSLDIINQVTGLELSKD